MLKSKHRVLCSTVTMQTPTQSEAWGEGVQGAREGAPETTLPGAATDLDDNGRT